jgi:hypothetical protein
MNFSLPHPERGRPLKDATGRWLPRYLRDDEIQEELWHATGERWVALAEEARYREGGGPMPPHDVLKVPCDGTEG